MPPLGTTAGPFKFLPFVGGAISTGAGFAVGAATAPTLRPLLQDLENLTWEQHPSRPIAAGALALGVAQGQIDGAWAVAEAARTGVNTERFGNLVSAANTGPGVPIAFDLWRRGVIEEADFRRAAKRQGLENEWITDLVSLKHELLDPGQIAAAIHRGLVPDPGLLKGEQPVGPFKVEAYPEFPIPPLAEAAGHGYTKDRLGVLVGLQGLPMGPHEAAQALFRGIITDGDYIRAFNESNNRNEWARAILEQSRQIPTARDYIENALRGYRTLAKAQEGAARHGMSAEDALLIFQNSGRPLNLHQITQALAWGGKYKPAAADDPDPWVHAVLLGAVRPEYYDLQEHLKYNLPSAFFFRVLQQQDVLKEAEAVTWYERLGWPPELAKKVATAFAKPAAATADPHIKKAQTQLYNTIRTAYLAGDATDAVALAKLPRAGVSAAAVDDVLALWKDERDVDRARLTAAQLKKAYTKAVKNPLTDQPWTRDEVLAELLARGWNSQDANTFLDTPSGP